MTFYIRNQFLINGLFFAVNNNTGHCKRSKRLVPIDNGMSEEETNKSPDELKTLVLIPT